MQTGFELLLLIIDPHQQNICNIFFQLVSLKITYLALQPTQSDDLLSKVQATHPFQFCCVHKIVKKEGFHMHLKSHGSEQVF